jgi:hypothetical protein
MGLKIHAINQVIQKVDDSEDLGILDDIGIFDEKMKIWVSPDFPDHCTLFEHEEEYYLGSLSEKKEISMGSFGDYNQFRRRLAKAALGVKDIEKIWDRPKEFKHDPFFNLICFSDCEGSIDYSVAEALHKDFIDMRSKVEDWVNENIKEEEESKRFMETYDNLADIFKHASDQGIIVFK